MGIVDIIAAIVVLIAGVVFTTYGWIATDYLQESPRNAKTGYLSLAFGIALLVFLVKVSI